MPTRLAVFEVSHRTARRTLREALARDGDAWVTDRVAHVGSVDDWRLLKTCGRFELYAVADEGTLATLGAALRSTWRGAAGALLEHRGYTAVEHLFRVAAGLESPILGEDEILGQVRDLLEIKALGANPQSKEKLLERMLQQAVYVGRRVRQETALNTAQHSYAERALTAAMRHLPARGRITIYGTGRLARSVCEALPRESVGSLSICSRHAARLAAFAEEFMAAAIEPDLLSTNLVDQDVLIACTAARQPVITAEMLAARRGTSLCIIDLGLPPNVAADVVEMPRVQLITLDDLVDAGSRDFPSIHAAEKIIADELTRFRTWRATQRLGQQMQATLAAHPDASPAERHARIRALRESVA